MEENGGKQKWWMKAIIEKKADKYRIACRQKY